MERIVLDPSEVADAGRVEIDLTEAGGAIQVNEAGIAWGEAAGEATMADGAYGSTPVDRKFPNRVHEIPLLVLDTARVSFDDARRALQEWVGLVEHTSRGWLLRELGDGTKEYADVVRASLRMGGDTLQALGYVDTNAVLVLETLPDWYGDEQLVGRGTITGGGVVEIDPTGGDYPARMRAVIEDTSGNSRRSLVWALRPANSDPTAAMDYAATDLTAVGTATTERGYIECARPPPTWLPVLSTEIVGVGDMTHVGPHRIWFETERIDSPSDQFKLRFEWSNGSVVAPTQNAILSLGDGRTWNTYGQVQLDRARTGDQRWTGRLLVYGSTSSTLRVRRMLILPVADSYGMVGASTAPPTAANVSAWDDYSSLRAGNLDSQVAPLGGTWTGAGATGAIQVGSMFSIYPAAMRRSTSDGSTANVGRLAYLNGIDAADVDVRARMWLFWGGLTTDFRVLAGLCARVRDADNYVAAGLYGTNRVLVFKEVSGTPRTIASVATPTTGGFHDVRMAITSGGRVSVYIDGVLAAQAVDSDLATGGALARGAVGLYDWVPTGSAITERYWFDFFADTSAPVLDAAVYARNAAELSTQGYLRDDGTGAYAALTPTGTLPRIPPGGAQLYVRPSRAPHGQSVGDEEDGATIEVYGRPCFLFTPAAS